MDYFAFVKTPDSPPALSKHPRTWLDWWIAPRSKDRLLAFQEKTLRISILGLLFIGLLLMLLISTPWFYGRIDGAILITLIAILSATTISRGHVRITIFIVCLHIFLLIIFSTLRQGYWTGLPFMCIGIALIFSLVLLKLKYNILFMTLILIAYAVIAFLSDLTATPYVNPLPGSDYLSNAAGASIFVTIYALMIISISFYVSRELTQRAKIMQSMIQNLDNMVHERTQDLSLAKEEADRARERAQAADRAKSEFLANMSHELRTPLNAILTFTDFMAMGTFGDVTAEQSDYLGKILFSGQHLLALINDVLDISKIQSGKIKLYIEDDFDLRSELENIQSMMKRLIGDKPVQISINIDPKLERIVCDKRRIRQVILNLMSNSVKFTDNGFIRLSVQQNSDDILVLVEDSGCGIPLTQQEYIFEPFTQTESGAKKPNSTGLGLPISKYLIEEHGGRMWLESYPDSGTKFHFSIPRHIQPRPTVRSTQT